LALDGFLDGFDFFFAAVFFEAIVKVAFGDFGLPPTKMIIISSFFRSRLRLRQLAVTNQRKPTAEVAYPP
jgi:hypothetical protein